MRQESRRERETILRKTAVWANFQLAARGGKGELILIVIERRRGGSETTILVAGGGTIKGNPAEGAQKFKDSRG